MEDFQKIFLEDAQKIISDFRREFASLKSGGENSVALKNIHRYAHSLKGISGMMKHDAIYSIAHGLEARLKEIVSGSSDRDERALGQIEAGFDKIEAMLKNG